MRGDVVELLDLTCFVEVARCSSFTGAAERLYVTQPTLSRRIARFERELGTKLFEREPQSVTLTPAGRELLPKAKQILDLCATVPELVRETRIEHPKSAITEVLRVGHQEFIDAGIMARAIKALRDTSPQVSVEPSVDRVSSLRKSVLAGRLDAAFLVVNGLFSTEGLEFHKILDGSMELLVSQDSPLAARSRVSIDELRDASFVMFSRDLAPAYYDFVSTQCINHGFMLDPACTVENMNEAVLAVASGMGVSFIYSHSSMMGELSQRGLCALEIDGADFSYDYGIAWRTGRDTPALHAFVQEVDAVAADNPDRALRTA